MLPQPPSPILRPTRRSGQWSTTGSFAKWFSTSGQCPRPAQIRLHRLNLRGYSAGLPMTRRWIEILILLSFSSCTRDAGTPYANSDYPPAIASIILPKCAVQGCHNTASRDATGGLSLATWNDLFAGSRNGPAVVPYRADFS